jgi:hypothetical protein
MTDSNSWYGTRPYTSDTKVHSLWLCQRDQPDLMVGTFATLERAEQEVEWIADAVRNQTSMNTLVTDFHSVEDLVEGTISTSTFIQTVPVKT